MLLQEQKKDYFCRDNWYSQINASFVVVVQPQICIVLAYPCVAIRYCAPWEKIFIRILILLDFTVFFRKTKSLTIMHLKQQKYPIPVTETKHV